MLSLENKAQQTRSKNPFSFKVFLKDLFLRTNSIKNEISILYTLILGLILVIFSSVFYVILSTTLFYDVDYELKLTAEEITQSIQSYMEIMKEQPDQLVNAVRETISLENDLFTSKNKRIPLRLKKQLDKLDLSELYINFSSLDGTSLVHSANLSQSSLKKLSSQLDSAKSGFKFKTISFDNINIRLVNQRFLDSKGKEYILQVGNSSRPIVQLLYNWILSLSIGIPLILFLTSFVGRLLAQRILSPVYEITKAAKKITYEDFSTRVKIDKTYIEMKDLIAAFNEMIERLEKSFQHIEQWSAHVAHELKTPLAIIRGEAELALKKPRDPQEYQRVIEVHLGEVQRMLKTIDDLLLLTRLDYQPEMFKKDEFEFNEFFMDIYESTKMIANNKKITVKLNSPSSPILMHGDKVYLRRLFFNLIDNALKYTSEGGQVNMDIKVESNKLRVQISDTGPGIPEEIIPRIFEKFFRSNMKGAGSGLGLNIAQSIAKIHGGEIVAKNNFPEHGTTFYVALPL